MNKIICVISILLLVAHLSADTGKDGMHFGASAGYDVFATGGLFSLDWYILNNGNHHLSLHGGVDPFFETNNGTKTVYGASLFYSIGSEDRLLIGCGYGQRGDMFEQILTIKKDQETGEFIEIYEEKEKIIYEPEFLIGYQRVFDCGLSYNILIGVYYSDLDVAVFEDNKKDFRMVYSIGLGWYF